ncbi:pitrilysin family protein [Alteromonas sp. C1M14]|uniref:M16 family metallopeptidase n=1 Tax=Alteromonas sp. C1M14 TaxID=2841567 RepID=UPI001C09EDB5|nr:pitrilysin family protein [Alteromonas sp. C1M14]MBU2978063.1 insulinase family protein [Alteromonas sp. C1M14]
MALSLPIKVVLCASIVTLLLGCQAKAPEHRSPASNSSDIHIPHTKYTLDNGLTVILHEDHSDPLVHVDVTYHVGSAREELGKSGFAHFFEHMMFQGSEHVADEEHFKIITEAGGTLNGSTTTDRTNYFETVPANQLEKMLWLEADRMGFLLPAVNQTKFENQRETVKNERGQRVDNKPYGLRSEKNGEALYPTGHPYSWSTIGYMEDLDRVNVNDLKAFFKRWYGPNNAVLTIGGDIDVKQTRQWIEKYFGTIPRGPEVEEPKPQPVVLSEDRYVTLEDKVHLPLLQVTFPTVYARHPDEAPLDVLADILGGGKTSLFYKNLVKEGYAVQANVAHPCKELACEFQLLALANPQRMPTLAALNDLVNNTLAEFEERGVEDDDLARTKAGIEASTIFGLQSVAGKVSSLASNETFYGEPDLVAADLHRYSNVTADDVMRVYRQYIKGKHSVTVSVVPQGHPEVAAHEQTFALGERDIGDVTLVNTTVTQPVIHDDFDRSVVPKAGPAPVVRVPAFWETQLTDNIDMLGVTSDETPTVTLTINLEGGMLLDPVEKAGLASFTAAMMNESTTHYANESLSNELAKLGSRIQFSASGRFTQIYLSSLTKNLDKTLALLEEKLFHPAFSEADFTRLKSRMMQGMQQSMRNPGYLADRAKDYVLFGDSNRVSLPNGGTLETVNNITLDDIKRFYNSYYSPFNTSVVAVSNLKQADIVSALGFLKNWQVKPYTIANQGEFPQYSGTQIFLVDNPGAVQSAVHIVKRALPFDATGDYFLTRLMNFPLGGGFNSRVNLNLREDKGYTYGASTSFIGGKTLGWFDAQADVNAVSTVDAIKEFISEIKRFQAGGMTAQELAFMRNAFTLSDALEYETPSSKVAFLRQMQAYDLPDNYREIQTDLINQVSLETLNSVAKEQLNVDDMQIIVVGDKASLEAPLAELGYPIVPLSFSENK